MRGDVLGFDRDSNIGTISGHDGRRYEFVRLEWRGAGGPVRGDAVDFIPDGPRATQIYPLGTQLGFGETGAANLVYILYLVSIVIPLASIVGIVIAYVNRSEAPEWLHSHYTFQIRTFWLALLYAAIGVLTLIAVVGAVILILVVIWWIVRNVKGLQRLSQGRPYPNPASWLW